MDRGAARNILDHDSSAFIKKLDQKSSELQTLLEEVGDICSEKENLTKKTSQGMIAGQVTLGVAGVLGICAAPFTGGISLALAGVAIATGVAGGGASLGVHLKNRADSSEINKRFKEKKKELNNVLNPLTNKLKKIEEAANSLQSEYNEAKPEYLVNVENKVHALVKLLKNFGGNISLSKAKDNFSKIMDELEEVRSLLQQLPRQLDGV